MNFKNLRLANKQRISSAIILILMAVVNAFVLYKIKTIKSDIDEVSQNYLPRAIALSDINFKSSELRRVQLQWTLTTDAPQQEELAAQSITLIDEINRNLDTYDSLKTSSELKELYSDRERQLFEQFDNNWDSYQDFSITFFRHIQRSEKQEAVTLLHGESKEVFKNLSASLLDLVDISKTDSFAAAKRAEVTFLATRRASIIILVISVLFSIFIADRFVRLITVPINKLEEGAEKVARGDLTVQLPVTSSDEVGSLSKSFNQMTGSLHEAKLRMDRQAQRLRGQNKVLEKAMRELRETQEKLVIQEKMASLGDLVAGIAHELNNPVGTMNGSLDVSKRCLEKIHQHLAETESLPDPKDRDLRKLMEMFSQNIEVTLSSGNRIAALVKSLKSFAQLDESEYKKADIREGLESTLTLMSSEFQDRIEVVKQFSEIPKIGCFPGQLNQVFLNLLKNAIDAIEGPGTIAIKTFRENGHVCVEISDSGRGIPKHKLSKIFDIGFATGASRIKMTSGLSTAYNIIQKHNGEIKIESIVGKGSTFSILLPTN